MGSSFYKYYGKILIVNIQTSYALGGCRIRLNLETISLKIYLVRVFFSHDQLFLDNNEFLKVMIMRSVLPNWDSNSMLIKTNSINLAKITLSPSQPYFYFT